MLYTTDTQKRTNKPFLIPVERFALAAIDPANRRGANWSAKDMSTVTGNVLTTAFSFTLHWRHTCNVLVFVDW